ncbi:single-stranded-DNA-specific exonuclease RecJ [Thermoleophilia bacterium SCSIO 60948]|nr:single-stranded-DNA-specific exonuclease RecJ [Thermoleophilia bacterium SCSIO 60948]
MIDPAPPQTAAAPLREAPPLARAAEPVPLAPDYSLEPYDYAAAERIARELGVSETLATILVRRGHDSPESARAFLTADVAHDPFEFAAMEAAVEAIRAAVDAGRRITVHGDYDVDGVCSTAITVAAIRELGGHCDWLIPDRMGSGYGLSAEGVRTLIARRTELLVTVDCGISCAAEVAHARDAGMEVVVTDHHEPGAELPDCTILHPRVPQGAYPFGDLCGTGVAHKLCEALLGAERAAHDLDLVALATVADLVTLVDENRSFVRRGIAEARRGRRPGLRALAEVARIRGERLDETDMAFRLAPRINAAGRLYRADAGVELMLTADEDRAREIAAELDRANVERRMTERAVQTEAERALRELPEAEREAPGLVLAGEGWHPGVVGIVASRIAERHFKPALLLAIDDEGKAKGSGRSVSGFDLLAALHACAEPAGLGRYGGHRAAAGLEIDADRIADLRAAFAGHATEVLGTEPRARVERADAIVGVDALGSGLAEELERLGPFGQANRPVRLVVPGAKLEDVTPMGESGRHARFSLASAGRRIPGVAFGVEDGLERLAASGPHDVSVSIELNEWNGVVSPRVVLGSVHEGSAAAHALVASIAPEEFWDRVGTEVSAPLEGWPGASLRAFDPGVSEGRRTRLETRGSVLARIATLASAGGTVLVLCAEAPRRRALLERSLSGSALAGAPTALISASQPEAANAAGRDRIAAAGRGVALADWGALRRDASLARGFEHIVVCDPPPFEALAEATLHGAGWVHRAWGPEEIVLARRICEAEFPDRDSLAGVYRDLRDAAGADGSVSPERARQALCGLGRSHPRTPEVAGRFLRVLAELGLLAIGAPRPDSLVPGLELLSSERTSLDRSEAFVAYRSRSEEGTRCLSEQGQPSPTHSTARPTATAR